MSQIPPTHLSSDRAAKAAGPPRSSTGRPLSGLISPSNASRGDDTPMPDPTTGPEASAPVPAPQTAADRVAAYLAGLGVGPASAERLVAALDSRVDVLITESGPRTAAMLETLDRWTDALAGQLGLIDQSDRVGFVVAMHLGRLLDQYPGAIDDPAPLLEVLQQKLDGWPLGVLPNWQRATMHRQPLGELPGVLQGQFWSGTYRWVVPVGASTGRRFRRGRQAGRPGAFVTHPGPAAGE